MASGEFPPLGGASGGDSNPRGVSKSACCPLSTERPMSVPLLGRLMLHAPAALDSMDLFHEGVAMRSQRVFSAAAVEMGEPDRLCLERVVEPRRKWKQAMRYPSATRRARRTRSPTPSPRRSSTASARGPYLQGRQPRLSQRHDPALRRGGGEGGVGAGDRLAEQVSASMRTLRSSPRRYGNDRSLSRVAGKRG